jgi:RNA polymerase sigma factor (sigma-70 family)
MPDRHVHTLLRRLCRAVGPDPGTVPDAELVRRYVASRDAAAFETLVWRHGPMVLGVCRRLLRHQQDAEDAFQAAFLALARKAGTVGRREAVAGWLYRVACRAAWQLRAARARLPAQDAPALRSAAAPPEPDPAWADLRPVLDEEIGRLPRKHREAFVLCCLEGLTGAEAARQLGCPPGTVLSRLSRARQRLRARLGRRGVGLTAGALAAPPASGALVRLTVRAGASCLAGSSAAGVLPSRVIALAEGVLRAMSTTTRLKIVAAACLVAVTLGTTAGVGVYRGRAAEPPAAPAKAEAPPAKDDAPPAKDKAPPPKADAALAQPAPLPLTGHKGAVRAIAFASNGKTVATAGADGTVRLWDAVAGEESLKLKLPGEAVSVAFSPDGKMIAGASAGKEGGLVSWDLTGKEVWRLPIPAGAAAFSPDGKMGAAVIDQGVAVGFDVASGRLFFKFKGPGAGGTAAAFSPDGKLLAIGDGGGGVQLVDAPTGKIVRQWQGKSAVKSLTFLPDGAKAAATDGGKAVRMLDLSNGKEETAFQGDEAVQAFAVSRDGKLAATVGKGGEVRLWDAAAGKEERRFAGGEAAINAVAFAPEGDRLATVSEDGTAVIWDLTRDEKPLAKDFKLTEKDMAGLWDDLAGDGAGKVYAALRMLRADPAQSVPFLQARLKPRAEGPDEKKVKKMIADLDADDFDVREQATKDLEKLGKDAEPVLREAVAAGPSAEAKLRLERLLKSLGSAELTPEQRRDVRAVRVLEQAGTPEAKKLLESLTKESPGWWVTQEAKAALERIAQRDKKP